jgi:hypothetical protein
VRKNLSEHQPLCEPRRVDENPAMSEDLTEHVGALAL